MNFRQWMDEKERQEMFILLELMRIDEEATPKVMAMVDELVEELNQMANQMGHWASALNRAAKKIDEPATPEPEFVVHPDGSSTKKG